MTPLVDSPGQQPTFALLENTRAGAGERSSFLFVGPCAHLRACTPAELSVVLAQVNAQRLAGHYVCGYVAYEAGYHLADKQLAALDKSAHHEAPLAEFFAFETCAQLDQEEVDAWLASTDSVPHSAVYDFALSESRAAYAAKIAKIHQYIVAGDTYQVNYTLRSSFGFEGSLLSLYRALRARQRVEYSAYLQFPGIKLASFSPELFVRKQGETLMSKPMKGTAARGLNPEDDSAICTQLRQDPKSQAENLMIVDLLRNDIGRLADTGSVAVTGLLEIETFETLHQMVSTIRGKINSELALGDVLQKLFPCGSITGAPKIRTMQIIDELEPEPRGVYTGAIGYVMPNNDFCFNVPIRTIVSTQACRATMGIGSGIVYDSQADAEFDECMLKAKFLTGINADFGLIETLFFDGTTRQIRNLDLHLARLRASAKALGFVYDPAHVSQAVQEGIAAAGLGPYRLRLQLHFTGELTATCYPLLPFVGTTPWLLLSPARVNSTSIFQYHKTTKRQHYDEAYQEAAAQGAYDILFLNEKDEVSEASRHNIFIERDGELLTPPICAGLLAGVGRQLILQNRSLGAREVNLTRQEVLEADKVFLVNSMRGWVQVQCHPSMAKV